LSDTIYASNLDICRATPADKRQLQSKHDP